MTNAPVSPDRSSDYLEIVPYREEWVQEYRKIIIHLRTSFPAGAIFHHIGSTAVPGLAAKDIIDIQATASSLDSVDADHLARVGFFEWKGASDHLPAGRTVSAQELTKRFFMCAHRRTNLHVGIAGTSISVIRFYAETISAASRLPLPRMELSRNG
jgi:GrpB-like predicted nucleotidyltransferase (UPF0157 family)